MELDTSCLLRPAPTTVQDQTECLAEKLCTVKNSAAEVCISGEAEKGGGGVLSEIVCHFGEP